MASELDDDWQPPTEAEMKVIQAKRERSDKISKIMGDYLLKGYKMLGTSCVECGTILLRDKQEKDYCVACSELESDTVKDNPALSTSAARVQAREGMYHRDLTSRERAESPEAMDSQFDDNPAPSRHTGTVSSQTQQRLHQPVVITQHAASSHIGIDSTETIEIIRDKITWASQELKSSSSVEYSIQLCQLIKGCADALVSVQNVFKSDSS